MVKVLTSFIFSIILMFGAFVNIGECAKSEIIKGIAYHVYDGDTIKIRTAKNVEHRIRLDGIDAPEYKQSFGRKSKMHLHSMIFNKTVEVVVHGRDKYKRILGTVYFNNENINQKMLKDGFAWHYKKYNKNSTYALLEYKARLEKKGLWSEDNPMAPWDYRKAKRVQNQKKKNKSKDFFDELFG